MIQNLIKKIMDYDADNSLFRDGVILLSATTLLNLSAFIYHFYMGRVLGPSSYGILGAMLSLVYLLNVPLFVLQTAISKSVSELKVKEQFSKINYLLSALLKGLTLYGVIAAAMFIFLIPIIASFLYIPKTTLYVLSPLVLFILLLPVNRGVLQGLQRFKSLGVNMVSEGFSKLALGVLLVFLGFGVNGAVAGITLSIVVSFFLGFLPLRNITNHAKEKVNVIEVYKFALPVFIVLTSLTIFYSADIILVKHFFNELEAGYYAALALLGKVVFFATLSINWVMFPKVVEMNAAQKPSIHILRKSLIFVLFLSAIISTLYFLFPGLVINLLFGNEYIAIKPLLGLFAVFMAFYSMVYILSIYNLSMQRTRFIYILILFNLLEVILISLFHQSLKQIVLVLLFMITSLFFILLILTIKKR